MKHAITLTPAALEHLKDSLQDSPASALGVRFGLRDAGCSGYAYTLDFTDTEKPNDQIFVFDNVKMFVDKDDLKALDGTQIDYTQQGVNYSLVFNNPNVVDQCGCGESFKFKDE